MRNRFLTLAVLAPMAGGLLYAAALAGWLQAIIAADQTGIVWAVAGVTLAAFASALRSSMFIDWVCEHGLTLLLGLLGTLIGFMAALAGVVGDDIIQKLAGVETALATTIAGLVAHMFLLIVARILK